MSQEPKPPAPLTQVEQELRTVWQQRISMVWELTQAFIAIIVTTTTLYVSAVLVTRGAENTAAFLLLSNAFFLVIGFFFGRSGK